MTVELGLRYDRASYTSDSDVSPRVNALFRLSERSSLRAGWGHYRQRQGIADLAALDGLNRYFPSELSKQWTVGFEHLFQDGGTLRVEGYHKTGSGLRPIYRNWKGGIDVFPESNEDRILVYPDRATSRGIETTRRYGQPGQALREPFARLPASGPPGYPSEADQGRRAPVFRRGGQPHQSPECSGVRLLQNPRSERRNPSPAGLGNLVHDPAITWRELERALLAGARESTPGIQRGTVSPPTRCRRCAPNGLTEAR